MTTVPTGETSDTIVNHYNDEKEENDDYYDDETSEDEEAGAEFLHFQKQQRQQQQQPEIDDESDDFDEDDSESESESEAWEDVSDDIVDDDESEIESEEEEIVLEEGEEDDVEENNDSIKNDEMLQRVRKMMLTDENSADDDDISEEVVSDDDEVEIVSEEEESDEYEEYDDEVDNGISKNEEMLQHVRADLQMVNSERPLKISVKDPKELEWRKKKIEEDLYSMIEEAEKEELKELVDTETIAALTSGAMNVALTKKYKDSSKGEYIYYPSVAKAAYDFPLIEEAEKNSGEELPFEIVTALCTIAALRLKGEDEVDENDIFIKKKTISVVLDDGRNTDESVEIAKRERTIKDELASIMLGISQQEEIGATLDADVAAALQKAALDVAYAKKYFDAENNEFVYFPSVAKTICSYSLIEEAEKYLGSADREISPDLTKILCIAAASYLKGNTNEVDEDNEDIMKISVDVDVRRSTVTEFSLVAEDSVAFSDASEADREPQSRSKPAVGKQSELETRNNDADEERQSKESLGSSATPVSAKLTLNNGSKVTPDLVEDESSSTDLRSESENDHRDTDGEVPESISPNEQINDPKITSQSVLTPTSGSILEESAKDMIDCSREDNEFIYTKEVEVDLDSNKTDHTQNHLVEDFDEEEARLKEMENKLASANDEHSKTIEVLMETQVEYHELKTKSWMSPLLCFL
ncbi:hypothetical protein FRACYDRAFT_235436 [Fragilariopsis cylindrus CCMP1102]|uniref:Uncharacterized protein n=1 Tax=Fragilariopsis cylindrus CCMP1102 TaxID=635003 RepID=A0A1E7FMH8_9STRA|nr:hypothetical protein FRACYDRAFT_235436 [Fragilariopsis cylindrus CCMP1102]|eukprot:OEU19382.1 hypothetical protein FRACYDRAFT_235436 [Fragilariopsis cylindrus CCMP1102]